jgi:hypothetical protein
MSVRVTNTHLISTAQTWVDGAQPGSGLGVTEGATWRWFGTVLRLDSYGAALLLCNEIGVDALHRRAAAVVRKLARTHGGRVQRETEPDDMAFNGGFVVSDGARFYPVVPIPAAGQAGPLLMFVWDIPPVNTNLTVIKVASPRKPAPPPARELICFASGTLIDTPQGASPVQDLFPGDLVLTKDDGPQEILWMGMRQISGARLHVTPSLRPVRIRAGALGGNRPQPDLVVSPDHRVLLSGPKAQALFNTPKVLVRAMDLVDDRRVLVDHTATQVTYIHLLLARHQVIWANGVPTESFHPASADLTHLNAAEMDEMLEVCAGVDRDPSLYGPHARRCLSAAELAILNHRGAPHYLA